MKASIPSNLVDDVQLLDKHQFHDRLHILNMLKSCSRERNILKVRLIHDDLVKEDLITKDVYIATTLITTYAKCGAIEKAQEVFNQIPVRNVVSWNALISGYVQRGFAKEALEWFRDMQDERVYPDAVTYASLLKACGIMRSLEIGEDIVAEVRRQGLLKKDVVLGNVLVDMYSKCGALAKAREVFDELPMPNVVSFSALIGGYVQHRLGDEALKCFKHMQDVGVCPNVVTYICVLKACGIVGALEIGKDIDAEVRKQGLLHKDICLGTALVDMYSKCGALEEAREVFDKLPIHDVVSWGALIAGYAQHGLNEEALKCFKQMQDGGIQPDLLIYVCILKACGVVGSLEIGEDIHAKMSKRGLLKKDIVLGNTLIGMYSKCSALERAQEVFEQLPTRDVVSWNALIAGYAHLGQANVVMDLYIKMRREDIRPNLVTFILLLNACSHAGLVMEGERSFNEMRVVYCLTPTLEHYTCMIGLFGRAGHFDKAKSLLDEVSYSGHLPLFLNILGACRKWRNVKLGRWAFEQSIQIDEKCSVAYVCMEKIYAAVGLQVEADGIEALRVKNKAWKMQGCCWWTDPNRNVHSFYLPNQKHPQSTHIYAKLKDIRERLSQHGYSPGLHWASQGIVDDKKVKKYVLCGYSEQLSIACALINTPRSVPIRVTKNMQICGDCHSAISLISMIENRKIQVSDANRVHIFEDGRCICHNYYECQDFNTPVLVSS